MSVLLLALGILVAAAGAGAIGFGIPINEFSLGSTLIIAGTTALAGGLILVALAAAVRQLARIADGLRARPAPRPVRPAEAPEAARAGAPGKIPFPPRPRAEAPGADIRPGEPRLGVDATVDVSSSAIERLRSTMVRDRKPDMVTEGNEVPLSPNGPGYQPQPGLAPVTRTETNGGVAVETRESRLDFLFRSRPPRPLPSEPFEAFWPDTRTKRAEGEAQPAAPEQVAPAPRTESAAPAVTPVAPEIPAPVAAGEPRPVEILKSGVVDGMAYTLYADGSIEAQLPQGTVRFGSIAELRAHIESNS